MHDQAPTTARRLEIVVAVAIIVVATALILPGLIGAARAAIRLVTSLFSF